MKNNLVFFAFLHLVLSISLCHSQEHRYYFSNTFAGFGGGTNLIENLACGASNGSFSSNVITTASGYCATQEAFCFNDRGGFNYPNANFISTQYTIHLFFKFNALGGYRRIIDFLNSTADAGIYALGNCLNFYPSGNLSCSFVANQWNLLSITRNASGSINVYFNGLLLNTYDDSVGNIYKPQTPTTPIIFFRDDNTVNQCEAGSGCVKYLSISPLIQNASQVLVFGQIYVRPFYPLNYNTLMSVLMEGNMILIGLLVLNLILIILRY